MENEIDETRRVPSILVPQQQFDMIDNRRAIQFDTDVVHIVDRMSCETTILAKWQRRNVELAPTDRQ